MKRRRVLIMGAAGRDFHNFLTYYRDKPFYEVVGFTAEQIPGIAKRKFPKELAGKLYKKDIPIFPEKDLKKVIVENKIELVALSYSDLSHQDVMLKAALVMSTGASFVLLGPRDTQIVSKKPVVSVTAVRTGAGKSQTSRKIARILQSMGYSVVAIRHPMPYGFLRQQEVQRFATFNDMVKHKCTIEEEEEYTPWIELGIPTYAGVDYEKILRAAEKEADVVIWDGGNNDFSFYKSDLSVVVADPHRAGHELLYYPGSVNFFEADVIVINKMETAQLKGIKQVEENIKKYNPRAIVVKAKSVLEVDNPQLIKGKKVIVVEDGPTVTHGGMPYGAGSVATKRYGGTFVDAQKYAVGSIKEAYKKYPHLKKILPAMGYSKEQVQELQTTINRSPADAVVDGSPFDMGKVLDVNKPIVSVNYTLEEISSVTLTTVLKKFMKNRR